ncbi:MAG: aminoacetone oxidase family FAD-binding enzyme [Bacilli bacterium]|nr:aminoacetone oxidase family FAD-binding enzyme [Bacilli bacterium]
MRIVVIGGGASGVICAIHAKNDANEVIILEKNDKLLKKLLLTGNGRCNYMHDSYSLRDYHSQNMEYLEDFLSEKNIQDVSYFFDSIGVISKNKNGYIYPFSNQASTVRDALIREVERKGIVVNYDTVVKDIQKKGTQFSVDTGDRVLYCDKVVLATGSYAYPKTGSDGSGYPLLEAFGHTIIKPLPALVQLTSDFPYRKDWDGVRCDVILSLEEEGEEIAREEGEVQLTDYGVSGICTFNLSHYATRGLYENKKEVIKINFVPFIETLMTPWMDRYNKKNEGKNISELLQGFLNKKIVPIILKVCHIREDVSYEDLTNEEKLTLCHTLKGLSVPITGTKDYESCQVCNGGVSLKEIYSDTMESKLVDGLYITGELLDINGDCGGFNLTECWISGILAGRSLEEME